MLRRPDDPLVPPLGPFCAPSTLRQMHFSTYTSCRPGRPRSWPGHATAPRGDDDAVTSLSSKTLASPVTLGRTPWIFSRAAGRRRCRGFLQVADILDGNVLEGSKPWITERRGRRRRAGQHDLPAGRGPVRAVWMADAAAVASDALRRFSTNSRA